ncbi:MAG: hypothetical protein AAF483_26740 [Planctomycetota bacterium]
MIQPASSVLSTALQKSFRDLDVAAEKIADPRSVGDAEPIKDLKVAEHASRATIAALKVVNDTTDHLIDIVV